jgi:hypothetical protein
MTLVTKYEWRAAAEAEGFFGYWQRPLLFFISSICKHHHGKQKR